MVNIANAIVAIVQAYAIGRLFGTQSSIEIYFAAAALYQSMVALQQSGPIAEIFTPIYHKLKSDASDRIAFDLLSVLLSWMILISVTFATLLFLGSTALISISVPGFTPERTATCIKMFQTLIPLLGLQIIQSLLSNLLAAEKRFVAQEVVRGSRAVTSLIVILAFTPLYDAWAMIIALWASNVLAVVVLYYLAARMGYRYRFGLSHEELQVSLIFNKLPSVFGYVCVTQLYAIALTAGLSLLPQGSIAGFSYARRIFSKISGVLIRPVSVVFFNHFSTALAQGDQAIQGLTHKAIKLTLILSTVTGAVVIVAGYPGLRWLWLSEKFPEAQVFQTYLAFSAFCVIPIFSGLGLIFRKINMSFQYVSAQYLTLMAVQVISAIVAYFVIPPLGLPGAIGVIIAGSILSSVACALLLKTKRPSAFSLYQATDLLKCGVMFVIVVLPLLLLQHCTNFHQWFPAGRSGDFLAACGLAVLCGLATLASSHLLKINEIKDGFSLALRKAQVWRK